MKKEKQVKRTKEQIRVLRRSNELLKNRINQLRTELREKKKTEIISPVLTDREIVSGLGVVHIGEKGNLVRLGTRYLERALKVLKVMDKDEVDIFITDDFPCVLGSYDSKKREIVGVIIAPRKGDDEL